jgi:hypothetical protein
MLMAADIQGKNFHMRTAIHTTDTKSKAICVFHLFFDETQKWQNPLLN